jgi:glutaredoxin
MNSKIVLIVLAVVVTAWVLQCMCNGSNPRTPRFVVYGSMQCGYTVKMLDYLKGEGGSVRFVDVNTNTGNAEFKRATRGKNIRGVPYTIDNNTNKGIRGFKEINL